jgi:hypothetical protein
LSGMSAASAKFPTPSAASMDAPRRNTLMTQPPAFDGFRHPLHSRPEFCARVNRWLWCCPMAMDGPKSPSRRTRRAGGDIDAEVLDLLASALQGDFQFELVAAVEICGRTIEGQQRRHFGGEALLEIGGFQRAALDGDAAVGGRDQEPDRRQGTSGAIGLDVGIDADAFVVAGRNGAR